MGRGGWQFMKTRGFWFLNPGFRNLRQKSQSQIAAIFCRKPRKDDDQDQDPLTKDLLHIWSWPYESWLLGRRKTMTMTKISSRKFCYTSWSSENTCSQTSLSPAKPQGTLLCSKDRKKNCNTGAFPSQGRIARPF